MKEQPRSGSTKKVIEHKSFSLERNSRKLAQSKGSSDSAEKFSRSPYMNSVNDLREELLKTKKAYSMALKDNSFMRTKLRMAEKDCKRKEKEIGNLLSSDQQKTSKYEEKLLINSLKKKVLHLERTLRSKTEENEYLLNDRNVAKAAENRQMLGKMETECNRLKSHLSQSIPEGEFLREKAQYMEIIDRLTEENMELRRILGEYEKNNKGNELLIRGGIYQDKQDQDPQDKNFRKQTNQYRDALSALFNHRRSRSAVVSSCRQGRGRPDRKKTSANTDHPSDVNGSIDSHSPIKKSSSNKVFKKAPAISVTIPARSKKTPVDKGSATSIKRTLAFCGAKSLDEERSVVELKEDRQPQMPSMYRHMSSSSSSENRQAGVIIINNEGVQSSFLIDENGRVLEEEKEEEDVFDNEFIYKSGANSSDEDAANLKELSREFNDPLRSKNEHEQLNLENVLRSIQSHALRLKMLGIRQESLKKFSKQL